MRLLCPQKKECPARVRIAKPGKKRPMASKGYQKNILGSTPLLIAALHLRDLARLEFMYGNSQEGIFLSQLAMDLRRIADGGSPRNTAAWRAVMMQFPRLFSNDGGTLCYARPQFDVEDCVSKKR